MIRNTTFLIVLLMFLQMIPSFSRTGAKSVQQNFSMEETMKFYVNSTKKAMEDGYSGFRAFVEVSELAKDFIGPKNFLTWEEYADKSLSQIKGENFQAVCAYDKKHFLMNT